MMDLRSVNQSNPRRDYSEDKKLNVLIRLAISSNSATNASSDGSVRGFFPESIARGIGWLYPNGTEMWKRSTDLFGDVVINCDAQALAQAFKDKAYRYIFSLPPFITALALILCNFVKSDCAPKAYI